MDNAVHYHWRCFLYLRITFRHGHIYRSAYGEDVGYLMVLFATSIVIAVGAAFTNG